MPKPPDIDDHRWEMIDECEDAGCNEDEDRFAIWRKGVIKERLFMVRGQDRALAEAIVAEHNRDVRAMHDAWMKEYGNG